MTQRSILLFTLAIALTPVGIVRSDELPPADEAALIHKYCGGCHSDKLMYGGMSVEHFDAAHPDPTLSAMRSVNSPKVALRMM